MARLIIQGITQSNGGTAKNVNIPVAPTNYTLTTSNCQIMDFTAEVFQDYLVGTNDRFDDSGTYHGFNCYMAHDAPEQWYHVNVMVGNTNPQENWQSGSVTPLVGGVNLMSNLINLTNLALAQAPVGGYDEVIFISNIPESTITNDLQDEFIKDWFSALDYFETQTGITLSKIFLVNTSIRSITHTNVGLAPYRAKRFQSYVNFMPTMDARIIVVDPLSIAVDSGVTINEDALEFNDVGTRIHFVWEWQKALSDYLIAQIFI